MSRVRSKKFITFVKFHSGHQILSEREKKVLYSSLEAWEESTYVIRAQVYFKKNKDSEWIQRDRICVACITQDHCRLQYNLKILDLSNRPHVILNIPLFTGMLFVNRRMKGRRGRSIMCFEGHKYVLSVMPTDTKYRSGVFRKFIRIICGMWRLIANNPNQSAIDKAVRRMALVSRSSVLARRISSRSLRGQQKASRRTHHRSARRSGSRARGSTSSVTNRHHRRRHSQTRRTESLSRVPRNNSSRQRLTRVNDATFNAPNYEMTSTRPPLSDIRTELFPSRRRASLRSQRGSTSTSNHEMTSNGPSIEDIRRRLFPSRQTSAERRPSLTRPVNQGVSHITNNTGSDSTSTDDTTDVQVTYTV